MPIDKQLAQKLLVMFKLVDTDNSGRIDIDESMVLINKHLNLSWPKDLIRNYIFLVSKDGELELGFDEFVRLIQCIQAKENEDQTLEDILFFAADLDCSGQIDMAEFLVICEKMGYCQKVGRETIVALANQHIGKKEINRQFFKVVMSAILQCIKEKGL